METILQCRRRVQSQGAEFEHGLVHFRTWCPGRQQVEAVIVDESGVPLRAIRLRPDRDGYFCGEADRLKPGALYKYRLDGKHMWPDPLSRYQPFGVHGPSAIVDPNVFQWSDRGWSAPPLRDLIIYELHIGTFTEAGTFSAAIDRLQHIADLGATAIEIMPVADFPGKRNWGYDGVMLYAPAHTYGMPDDFRALVNAAHERGLAVILDVVYNHLGPDGNYLGCYTPDYVDRGHETPWGAAFNLSLRPVRDFFAENPIYWMREFHIDGFRLDATHEIYDTSSTHLLSEIAANVHDRGGFVVAEDERNEPRLISLFEHGGVGLDGCWADDFHHVVRVTLTGEQDGYFANYQGGPNELCETLQRGWLFRGQPQPTTGKPRGRDPAALPPERFIFCVSNHDQVGNRAFGERISQIVSPAAFRAASALLLLAPYTPLLFMGQEWAASTPFQFFTDHNDELGPKITSGRRREFRNFAAFRSPELLEKIPDPQAEETFVRSKLRWDEASGPNHRPTLELYRELIRLRRECLTDRARGDWEVEVIDGGFVIVNYSRSHHLLVVDLVGQRRVPRLPPGDRSLIFSSNDRRFGGNGELKFTEPTVVLYKS